MSVVGVLEVAGGVEQALQAALDVRPLAGEDAVVDRVADESVPLVGETPQ